MMIETKQVSCAEYEAPLDLLAASARLIQSLVAQVAQVDFLPLGAQRQRPEINRHKLLLIFSVHLSSYLIGASTESNCRYNHE